MRDLQKIFGQEIQLKWNHWRPRIKLLNSYYMSQMFPQVKLLKDKKDKTVLIEIEW